MDEEGDRYRGEREVHEDVGDISLNKSDGLFLVTWSPRGRAFEGIFIQSSECTLEETVCFLVFYSLTCSN